MSIESPQPAPAHARPVVRAERGLSLHVTTGDGARTVRARGRLVAGAGATHSMWMPLARELGRDLRLDLSGVSALDAAGVGRLLHTRDRLAARGARLIITRTSPRVRRVLDLVGLLPLVFAPTLGPHRVPVKRLDVRPETELCGCGR